jgi:CubicO group peptidase (beta-lactamase class C family)
MKATSLRCIGSSAIRRHFTVFFLMLFVSTMLATAHASQSSLSSSVAPPVSSNASSIEELKAQLEKILKDSNTPGMSVAIVRRDGPEWIAGLGLADVATNRPATEKTLFRIGSTSKGFVALSILKLVNEGKLSLMDPVHNFVPEVWFENKWEETDPVRVVDLLEHTTGWDDMHLREYAMDAPGDMTLRSALDYDHRSRTSRWKPGTRMAYCNSGPAVAAYIVEKLSGQRFEDYVRKNFFDPLGMHTATYFQPPSDIATTLYRTEGKTPFRYWNILFRPVGAVNASAEDMAAYLQFYLNRGAVNGSQILPVSSIDRMETPTRDWAAQAGSTTGYGLANYVSIDDGFVYHGHDGDVSGGHTRMHYLKESGVGYFFSVNSDSSAIDQIEEAIQHYITRGLARPALPPIAKMNNDVDQYTGWYQPDSPRNQMAAALEILSTNIHVRFNNNKMYSMVLTQLQNEYEFEPVTPTQFRLLPLKDDKHAPAPVVTDVLLPQTQDGIYLQGYTGQMTLKHIPRWLFVVKISAIAWFLLATISIFIYTLCWMIAGLFFKRFRKPADRRLRVWPTIALLTFFTIPVIGIQSAADPINRLGNLTPSSAGIFISTIVFPLVVVTGLVVWWRADKSTTRPVVRWYSLLVLLPMLFGVLYFAYWGLIGIRTWP